MPQTFNVISLGQHAQMDTTEGNYVAENAADLVGMSFGSADAPLLHQVQTLAEGSAGAGTATAYDMDNTLGNDTFSINGGAAQTFDGTAVFNATLTYTDGTTATITAVVFQDTDGNTYLAPEFAQNSDQTALEAKPIQSMSLDSLAGNRYLGMTSSREDSDFMTCFVTGTLIETPGGAQRVDRLNIGDQVITRDHGPQKIRWIGGRTVRCKGPFVPIRIDANALGSDLPHQTLCVSRQHRMLVASPITHRMFNTGEVLIAAHKLLDLPGVRLGTEAVFVTFWHILCDRHEVVFANGAPCETLYLGAMARRAMGDAGQDEIARLFPDLLTHAQTLAHLAPKGHAQSKLVARLVKNRRAALEGPARFKAV
jgi:hypothetical protein